MVDIYFFFFGKFGISYGLLLLGIKKIKNFWYIWENQNTVYVHIEHIPTWCLWVCTFSGNYIYVLYTLTCLSREQVCLCLWYTIPTFYTMYVIYTPIILYPNKYLWKTFRLKSWFYFVFFCSSCIYVFWMSIISLNRLLYM